VSIRTRTVAWSGALLGALAAVVVASAGIGPVSIPPSTVAKVLLSADPLPFAFDVGRTDRIIVRDVRLPRIALAAFVGFALATAGTVMQGFFRNPMADPSIIGVSSGAAVGAVAVIALGGLGPLGLETAAFVGALLAAFAVYLIATRGGRTPVATLLLAGVAVQALLGAVVSLLLLLSGENLREAIYWLMGHLHRSEWGDVAVAAPVVLAGFLLLLPYVRELNVLLLGEEDAHAVGVDVQRTKVLLLAGASLVTAVAVSVAGVIGFVGLIVPHGVRLLVGLVTVVGAAKALAATSSGGLDSPGIRSAGVSLTPLAVGIFGGLLDAGLASLGIGAFVMAGGTRFCLSSAGARP
jgi:iron complex transport system permease protein